MEITVGLAMSPGSWIFKEEPLVSLVQDFFYRLIIILLPVAMHANSGFSQSAEMFIVAAMIYHGAFAARPLLPRCRIRTN